MEIQGYSNYLIYDDGRVYSKKRKIFLKLCDNGTGYKYCNLSKDGKHKPFTIHRLVALHYIPNPENKSEVDHRNRNKEDNRVDNLRWATSSENSQNTGINKNNTTGFKNIRPTGYGKYRYEKIINGKYHQKYFKTLEEAIQYKEEYEKSLQI